MCNLCNLAPKVYSWDPNSTHHVLLCVAVEPRSATLVCPQHDQTNYCTWWYNHGPHPWKQPNKTKALMHFTPPQGHTTIQTPSYSNVKPLPTTLHPATRWCNHTLCLPTTCLSSIMFHYWTALPLDPLHAIDSDQLPPVPTCNEIPISWAVSNTWCSAAHHYYTIYSHCWW